MPNSIVAQSNHLFMQILPVLHGDYEYIIKATAYKSKSAFKVLIV